MTETSSSRTRPLKDTTVLGVFSHPDDESLACGGTLARLAEAGARIVLVCATRGERGSLDGPVKNEALGAGRVAELRCAASLLGVVDLTILDFEDGNLKWDRTTELQANIDLCLRRYRPAIVITFGKDGLYWHPDHIAIHDLTTASVTTSGAPIPSLYFVSMPPGVVRGIVDGATARGWVAPSAGFWSLDPDAFGAQSEPPTLIVDVKPWTARKLAAIRCHQSQFGLNGPFSLLDESEAHRWLGTECFRQAPDVGSTVNQLERCLDAPQRS